MENKDDYDWNDYGQDIAEHMIPWAVCAGVALLLFVLSLLIWLFKCLFQCCCKCCRNKSNSSSLFMLRFCVGSSFALVAGVMVCVSLAVHFADNSYESYMQGECAAYRSTYTLQHGTDKQSDNWLGIEPAIDSLNLLKDEFHNNYADYTNENWKGTEWLTITTGYELEAYLSSYYNEHKDDTILSPYPEDSADTELTPSYVNKLGPTTVKDSYTGLIESEMNEQLLPAILYLYSMKALTLYIETQLSTIDDSLKTAIQNLQDFDEDVTQIADDVQNWVLDYDDDATSAWRWFTVACVLLGWCTMLIFLLTICILNLHTYRAARLFCCGWLIFAFIGVLAAVLCALLATGSYVIDDTCDFSSELVTTDGLYKYDYLIPSRSAEYLDVCFNQDGDLASYLGLDIFLDYVDQLLQYYQDLKDLNLSEEDLTIYDSVNTNLNKVTFSTDPNNYENLCRCYR